MLDVAAIILAAGKGTRMKSDLPKVLHKAAGEPMICHVLHAVSKAGIEKTVVIIGHGAEQVKELLGGQVEFALQAEQLGTGHAVMQTEEVLGSWSGDVLVLCGDTPLITSGTLKRLVTGHKTAGNTATVLTAILEDPSGYGRIIRGKSGDVEKIVEQKDASPEELRVKEINTGFYCFKARELYQALREITPVNAQGEYYLTDVLEIMKKKNLKVGAVTAEDSEEILGINNRSQLAQAEKVLRQRVAERHMLAGVTIIDPEATYIDSGVVIGTDTVIYPGSILEGDTQIGAGCIIGPNTRIVNSVLADNVNVQYSVILNAKVGAHTSIGPFAYLRPGTVLRENVKVGDFVEIKNSNIGAGSKVPHLSYVGDADVGEKVNIGAGTITCNYDGYKKSRTIIEDGAFIGSNTNLVAPVRVGKHAFTAAGSTITKDVPSEALSVERAKQVNYPNWASRKKD
ncbi:UDP-N-acetylglucosamine pyrophosphorylase [Thermincola potens JR]|uniref:Bifunctional protein GlmU n=1 Tax=Thermincola potens (strain JR) TaxID=635013 RepID=D5X924_THEPJ|nr:UDP-N-acetylglucosamine pyrophosphorylase [Thermincola potens JR]